MPRNSGGTYSSPSSSFVTATVISSNVMNGKLDDLGAEITASLSRNGDGAMLAPMRVPDGTINLPGYAYDNETTLGLRRAGAGDLRVCKDGTDIMKFMAVGITALQAFTAEKGLTVTNSTTNGAGTTTTGNGTGAGLVGTGGATGNGGTFTGGATSGAGVVGTGTGGGNGGTFTGQGAAPGVNATGGATGNGVTASGGGTSGYGVQGTGVALAGVRGVGGTNSPGLLGAGTGTGAGVQSVGGATGVGGHFTGGTTGDGVRAIGAGGSSSGIYATGAATGVGGYFEAGTVSTGADPTLAATLKSGHLFIDAAAPNSTEAMPNRLTPSNIPKALALIDVSGGTASVVWGFGITSVAVAATDLTVTFASAFTPAPVGGNPTYLVKVESTGADESVKPNVGTFTATAVDLRAYTTSSGGAGDLSAGSRYLMLTAYGNQ